MAIILPWHAIDSRARRLVFPGHAADQRLHRLDIVNTADALPGTPNIPPSLEFRIAAGAKIHLCLVGLGKLIGIKASTRDAAAQVVPGDAAEQGGIDNVFAAAVDQHLLVLRAGVALLGGDETRPEIGK